YCGVLPGAAVACQSSDAARIAPRRVVRRCRRPGVDRWQRPAWCVALLHTMHRAGRDASMSRLTRKNLMVDEAQLRELAQRWGLSESATVRRAISYILAAEEAVQVFEELHARGGGVDDVFDKFSLEKEEEARQAHQAELAMGSPERLLGEPSNRA